MSNTHYDFTKFDPEELVRFVQHPPTDVEAADWKAVSKELAWRYSRVLESVRKF